jgi:hypothetical protein
MFYDWCFEVTRNNLPDFILKSDKKFHIWVGENEVDGNCLLINRFSHRISSIQMDSFKFMMNFLEDMKPYEFPHLTTLDFEFTSLENKSLLLLAPQLQNLRLVYMQNYDGFDLTSVDEASR